MSTTRSTLERTRETGATTGVLHSARAELLRLRKWPAVWVVLGAWLVLGLMFGYLFDYISYKTGSSSLSNDDQSTSSLLAGLLPGGVPDVLVQGMPMFGAALMLVLGAITAGNGYGWGTWKTVLTTGPRRSSVVGGSLLALSTFVVGVVVVTLFVFTGVSLVIAGVESAHVVWPSLGSVLSSLGTGVLVMEMWALGGYLLGTVARGPALSVGLGLVYALVVENLLRGVGSLLSFVDTLTHFLPGTAGGSLVGSVIGGGPGLDTPGVLDAIGGGRALITVASYVVLLPLLTLWLVRRRDVS